MSEARNHSTPPDVLRALADGCRGSEDESKIILPSLAKNPSSPADLLEFLAQQNYAFVKEHVAANPATPVHVLLSLAEADSPSVIATNSLIVYRVHLSFSSTSRLLSTLPPGPGLLVTRIRHLLFWLGSRRTRKLWSESA
jgi:hypothetical protein